LIKSKQKSFLCIGLDVDLKNSTTFTAAGRSHFEFNKAIIDATHDLVSYKPNTAFYEAYGIKGWMSLQKRFSTSTKIT
jgi:orotidine-5'-phosphate decarboxylase